jgi:hypothetical protein
MSQLVVRQPARINGPITPVCERAAERDEAAQIDRVAVRVSPNAAGVTTLAGLFRASTPS